ncbi:MAG TPA: energy-coupled thiamine transporter ThiT [Clostridiales bacterium]|nr:energy-coupled thiamine transporter ThiT [Clostridiales bacterium]
MAVRKARLFVLGGTVMSQNKTKSLVECAIMIALATVLSMIKLAELPYGGSITIASMLPIAIIAYRRGMGWGLGSAFVYGVVQQLLGLNSLSYVTTWQSIVAVILLDYIVAFTVIGFAGIFRNKIENQALGLTLGCVFVSILRYICHVISGATVWAGLSIPTQAALSYSFVYNATYMLPECIILAVTAAYIGSVIDFREEKLKRVAKGDTKASSPAISIVAGLVAAGAVIYDAVEVFSHLQNAETGEFDITGLAGANWTAFIAVTVSAVVVTVLLLIVNKALKKGKTA